MPSQIRVDRQPARRGERVDRGRGVPSRGVKCDVPSVWGEPYGRDLRPKLRRSGLRDALDSSGFRVFTLRSSVYIPRTRPSGGVCSATGRGWWPGPAKLRLGGCCRSSFSPAHAPGGGSVYATCRVDLRIALVGVPRPVARPLAAAPGWADGRPVPAGARTRVSRPSPTALLGPRWGGTPAPAGRRRCDWAPAACPGCC